LIGLQVNKIILNKIWFSDNKSCKYNGLTKVDLRTDAFFVVATTTKGNTSQARKRWPFYRPLTTPPGQTGVHSGLLEIVFDVQVKNGYLIRIN